MTQAGQPRTHLTESSVQRPPTDAEVVSFLATNPDFFQRFPQILETLHIPHGIGSTVSLIEKQIDLLRKKNKQLEEQMHLLISTAHNNHDIQQQMHKIVVAVLENNDAESAMQNLSNRLSKDFQVDHVVVRLLADTSCPLENIDPSWILTSQSARSMLDRFTPTNEPVCGQLKPEQLDSLFGKQAEFIGSAVLIPIRKGALHGIIALGSRDKHRFSPEIDTLYLKHMGELVATSLLHLLTDAR